MTKKICYLLTLALLTSIILCSCSGESNEPDKKDDDKQEKQESLFTEYLFEASVDDPDAVSEEDMKKAVFVINKRLYGADRTDISATYAPNSKVISVKVPNGSDISDVEELITDIGELLFVDPNGNTILTENDIISATAQYECIGVNSVPEHFVEIRLDSYGVQKFSRATLDLSSPQYIKNGMNYIEVTLDGEIITMPYVSEQLTTETVMITGNFTKEDVAYLVNVINSKSLPFRLNKISE